jgi:hypothetical protein
MELLGHIKHFAEAVGCGDIDVYNEFSLQHELGIFLRKSLSDCKIEFERSVSHFHFCKSEFEKKEIDIVVIPQDSRPPSAIELKYPRNGQVPESMFGFCKDIAFLERLVRAGFQSGYFLAFADHHRFYSGNGGGIYGYFRAGVPINGTIAKPTGTAKQEIIIQGEYYAEWVHVLEKIKFCLISINPSG